MSAWASASDDAGKGGTNVLAVKLHAAQPPSGSPPPPLEVRGNRIVSSNTGNDIRLQGINWFGYNVVSDTSQ